MQASSLAAYVQNGWEKRGGTVERKNATSEFSCCSSSMIRSNCGASAFFKPVDDKPLSILTAEASQLRELVRVGRCTEVGGGGLEQVERRSKKEDEKGVVAN